MKKFDFRNIKFRHVKVSELSDNMLLLNLYLTQALTLIIGIVWILLQGQSVPALLRLPDGYSFALWAAGVAAAVLGLDFAAARFAPEEAADDGGMNERLFRRRPLWHIAAIALLVSFCEELLFRGAIQHQIGPYWTSIVFAAIHVRYLKHWIPTGLVFAASYGLGWAMAHTGTIWTPIGAHFIIDMTMGSIIRLRRDKG